MKKKIISLLLIIVSFVCCATVPITTNLSDISEAFDKEWKLVEVRVSGKNTGFNRTILIKEGFGEIFTLRIEKERISGVGAPNRYFGPYTVSEEAEFAVKIERVASTLMMPLRDPEKLKEHEFFDYLHKTYKWGLAGDNLELYSKNADGAEVLLIFGL